MGEAQQVLIRVRADNRVITTAVSFKFLKAPPSLGDEVASVPNKTSERWVTMLHCLWKCIYQISVFFWKWKRLLIESLLMTGRYRSQTSAFGPKADLTILSRSYAQRRAPYGGTINLFGN
jgi:hypothetical protein